MIIEGVTYAPSPNFSERGHDKPELIVDHYTRGGRAQGTVSWLTNPVSRRSSHFVISREGTIWQLVELDKKAWHAGISECTKPSTGEVESNVNTYSIGIEYANCGFLVRASDGRFWYDINGEPVLYTKDAHPEKSVLSYDTGNTVWGYWEPFRDEQIKAGQWLHEKIVERLDYDIPHVGHDEIAMPYGRKCDPGPLFPRDQFPQLLSRCKGTILS
jgi:N-acetylmuramoyl-L-alanine amidase